MDVKDEACRCTLLVRHLPQSLTEDEKTSLLQHFGATRVRVMGNHGRMKNTAFAMFCDVKEAEKALSRLHQLEVLGTRISVEYSRTELQKLHPKIDDSIVAEPAVTKVLDKQVPIQQAVADDINQFSRHLQYPLNPRLKYRYPAPSMAILTNIANALASVPKFYVQVLHLMNKMNLPAPFGVVTATPPLPQEVSAATNFEQDDMEVSSSEESEIETEDNEKMKMPVPKISTKRKAKNSLNLAPKLKLQKLTQGITTARNAGTIQKPEEVFEQAESKPRKTLELKIPSTVIQKEVTDNEPHSIIDAFKELVSKYEEREGTSDIIIDELLTIVEQNYNTEPEQDDAMAAALKLLEKYQTDVPKSSSAVITDIQHLLQKHGPAGFGVIQPLTKESHGEDSDREDEEINWSKEGFISSKSLRRGRMSKSEMKALSVFKNYKAGDPTSRLYVKNIHSKTTEKQLHFVYGKYINWDNEIEKNMFDIRLMKEGRMKGQAFVTLGNEKSAQEALNDTNGFMLNDKPLVVQFARSAKPKDDEKATKS